MKVAQIEPAMTPEQWAAFLERGTWIEDGVEYIDADDPVTNHDQHELAARALYGQPFGFTWDDVDDVLAALANDRWTRPVEYATAIRGLADRIATLLPPRKP